jgi:mono/diheme cytochrome c family protein
MTSQKPYRLFLPVLVFAFGLLSASICSGNEPTINPSILIPPSTYKAPAKSAESVRGQKQFQKYNCATCHSVESEGGCIAPPFDGIGARRSKEFILARITKDAKAIKAFEKLYPQGELFEHPRIPAIQAKEIAAYLLTIPDPAFGFRVTPHSLTSTVKIDDKQTVQPKKDGPKATQSDIASGREVFNQRGCIACHSIGNFGGHFAPRLDGISSRHDRDYVSNRITAAEFYAQKNPDEYGERGTVMLPSGLTKEQIQKVTSYLMSLPAGR